MIKEDICFIVLFYKAFEVTKKCVECIRKIESPEGYNKRIIIVDNASPDDGYEKIKSLYNRDEMITIIHNEKNLGFAKGNNVGFLYAKRHFFSKFIILTNSDAYIYNASFLITLLDEYERESFDVAGPDIISLKDGSHQNPEQRQFYSPKDVIKRIFKLKLLYLLCFINLDVVFQKIWLNINSYRKKIISKDINNIRLFGAFLIFSRKYINSYDGLYDGTFMYGEEDILRYIIERDKLKMRFLEKLCVFHEEGASTSAVYGRSRAKRFFLYKNSLKSCNCLLSLMKKENQVNDKMCKHQ